MLNPMFSTASSTQAAETPVALSFSSSHANSEGEGAKRIGVENSGLVYYDEKSQTIECLGCMEKIEIPHRVYINAHALLEFEELTELDHKECARYKSIEDAQLAREYRKESKRQELQGHRQYKSR